MTVSVSVWCQVNKGWRGWKRSQRQKLSCRRPLHAWQWLNGWHKCFKWLSTLENFGFKFLCIPDAEDRIDAECLTLQVPLRLQVTASPQTNDTSDQDWNISVFWLGSVQQHDTWRKWLTFIPKTLTKQSKSFQDYNISLVPTKEIVHRALQCAQKLLPPCFLWRTSTVFRQCMNGHVTVDFILCLSLT